MFAGMVTRAGQAAEIKELRREVAALKAGAGQN
jgi:hypothetical protein